MRLLDKIADKVGVHKKNDDSDDEKPIPKSERKKGEHVGHCYVAKGKGRKGGVPRKKLTIKKKKKKASGDDATEAEETHDGDEEEEEEDHEEEEHEDDDDEEKEEDIEVPAEKPAADESKPAPAPTISTFSGKFDVKHTKYENIYWENLPEDARDAIGKLGFDQDSWDNYGYPPCETKWFSHLTAEEREAAEFLGWDKTSWDTKYEDKWFGDLPEHVRAAAESLGFTAKIWDDDCWPPIEHKYWKDMTEAEQEALNVIGWHKWKWD